MENDIELILVIDCGDMLNNLPNLVPVPSSLLEHNIYQRFGNIKNYYRIDKGNDAIGQQRHIHVFTDDKGRIQLFAINYNGTTHDGSKYILSKKEQEALIQLGIPVPPNGLIEWELPHQGKELLLD